MQLLIKFTKLLQFVENRGWKSGDVDEVFPFEVIDHISHVGGETTLVLMPPTQVKFEHGVFTFLWESSEKTTTASVHANLIADLNMQRR